MMLSPKHQHELIVGSGITEGVVSCRGYRTAMQPEQLAELGFSHDQCIAPALIIPIHGIDGGIVTYQIKPDEPRQNSDGKPIKYETPKGSSVAIDICPLPSIREMLKNPAHDLWITEGVKKGDSAATRGLCCIALMGVWNWRGKNDFGGHTELADWEGIALKGRKVYIAFDSDVMTKPAVQQALRRLAAFLRRRGARQVVPIVPFRPGHEGKMGLDDFFVAGGTRFELEQCAEPSILSGRTIKANNRQLGDITQDALDALIESNDPPTLFVRDGKLARVTYDERNVPKIADLGPNALRGMMARSATWVKSGDKSVSDCPPPKDVVDDLMSLPGWPGVPPITSVTICPVLSPSGTLRREHGYDPESRFYVASPGTWPTWEGSVESARDFLLEELLGDFAFATQADRANALAMLILPVVRPAIDGPTPMHLIDAPVQGSGKSLLAEVCLMATCGDHVRTTPGSVDEDEWRKKIIGGLLDGKPYVWFDNVTRLVRADALDIVLTSREISDRRLGVTEIVSVPINCTWVMTSNNAELSRDMVRRTCWIRIDPQMERPEERSREYKFRHPNIKAWVTTNRGQLLAAICKLVEAWIEGGKKCDSTVLLGSYEEWCKTVGGILETAGVDGFMGNLEALRESSSTTETAWEGFMKRWWDKLGAEPVKAGDVRELFEQDSDLAGLLGNGNELSRTTRLGHMIKRRVDRIVGGMKITRNAFKAAGATTYSMAVVSEVSVRFGGENAKPHQNLIGIFEPENGGSSEVSEVCEVLPSCAPTRSHDARAHAGAHGSKPHKPHKPHEMNPESPGGLDSDGQNVTETSLGGDDEVIV